MLWRLLIVVQNDIYIEKGLSSWLDSVVGSTDATIGQRRENRMLGIDTDHRYPRMAAVTQIRISAGETDVRYTV